MLEAYVVTKVNLIPHVFGVLVFGLGENDEHEFYCPSTGEIAKPDKNTPIPEISTVISLITTDKNRATARVELLGETWEIIPVEIYEPSPKWSRIFAGEDLDYRMRIN